MIQRLTLFAGEASRNRRIRRVAQSMLTDGYLSPILLPEKRLAYYPVPKCACTSIKEALFCYKTGKAHSTLHPSIHQILPSTARPVPEPAVPLGSRCVVIRDPLDRFISAYNDRVVRRATLVSETWQVPIQDLDPKPDLRTFVTHLHEYCMVSRDVRHHFRSVVDFTGPDIGQFEHVFQINEMDRFTATMKERYGVNIVLPHSNHTVGTDHEIEEDVLRMIVSFLRPDYAALSHWYVPPVAVEECAPIQSTDLWRFDLEYAWKRLCAVAEMDLSDIALHRSAARWRRLVTRGVLD